jgi:hypothetical protein
MHHKRNRKPAMSTPFYDLASLVVVPSGYKSGKIYAQKPLTTDGQLTFTRASTATRVNASGLIETVSSGVPRLDYQGSTCPKILLEPQRTNIATQSNNYSGFNKGADTGVTLNSTTSPDGTSNATLVYCINTTTNGYIAQGFTGSSSTLYTVSFYAKKKELDLVYIKNVNDTGGQSYFNLTTGVATLLTGIDSVSMTAVGNGWYRCVAKSTSASTNVQWIPIIKGNANQGLYIYGLQIEAGAYETSLIPTSGSAVTRVEDAAYKTGISSLIGQTEGTLFVDFTINGLANYGTPISVNNGSTANYIWLTIFANGTLRAELYDGTVQASISFSGAVAGGRYKMAFGYKTNDFALYVNGALVGTDLSGSTFSGTTLSRIDFDITNPSTYSTASESINQALVFKTRLTNAQLAELTTL